MQGEIELVLQWAYNPDLDYEPFDLEGPKLKRMPPNEFGESRACFWEFPGGSDAKLWRCCFFFFCL